MGLRIAASGAVCNLHPKRRLAALSRAGIDPYRQAA